MKSFNFAKLIGADAAKPTLRERAASLKASAVRVIRRPELVDAELRLDWSNPPEGFLPYPVDVPAAFLNISDYLRHETQRLHAVALAEFARRKQAYEAGMSGSELAGALDRLRRRLRLVELEQAANPECAISTEFTPGDGNILYEDANGMVHDGPIAKWLGFMAMRMYAVAKEEESRAFNEKSVPNQEANRLLEDGLRRHLRLDALFDLAFRSDAVFEAAKDSRIGQGPVARLSLVDDLLSAWCEWTATAGMGDSPEEEAAWERNSQIRDRLIDTADALPATAENVPAKAVALAWISYVELWFKDKQRQDYATNGRLALDIHAAAQRSTQAGNLQASVA